MAREERRLDFASRPMGGPVPVAQEGPVDTGARPGASDGAHMTLSRGQAAFVALAGLLAALGVALDPNSAMTVLHHLFFGVFLLGGATRLAAACTPLPPVRVPLLAEADLPTYTIIAPLYREAEVVAELVQNLVAIDYPRDRLQALIVLEADDEITKAAVRALDLPAFVQVLIAPPGVPKTKPRACNHALDRARGELVVIYDAEDMPDPGQLREAAARFAASDPRVACLLSLIHISEPTRH